MKIELIRNEDKTSVGYKLVKEDTDDAEVVYRVRDMLYWGTGYYEVVYDGAKFDPETGYPVELQFKYKGIVEEEIKKMFSNI